MFAKLLCCFLFVLMWEGKFISITQNISRPQYCKTLQGSNSTASNVAPSCHRWYPYLLRFGDIQANSPNVQPQQVALDVYGWNKHAQKRHVNSKLSEVTKSWQKFLHFRSTIYRYSKTKTKVWPWKLTRNSGYDRIHPIHGTISLSDPKWGIKLGPGLNHPTHWLLVWFCPPFFSCSHEVCGKNSRRF